MLAAQQEKDPKADSGGWTGATQWFIHKNLIRCLQGHEAGRCRVAETTKYSTMLWDNWEDFGHNFFFQTILVVFLIRLKINWVQLHMYIVKCGSNQFWDQVLCGWACANTVIKLGWRPKQPYRDPPEEVISVWLQKNSGTVRLWCERNSISICPNFRGIAHCTARKNTYKL